LPVSFSLCLEHVEHWERIASRGRPAFSSHLVNAVALFRHNRFVAVRHRCWAPGVTAPGVTPKRPKVEPIRNATLLLRTRASAWSIYCGRRARFLLSAWRADAQLPVLVRHAVESRYTELLPHRESVTAKSTPGTVEQPRRSKRTGNASIRPRDRKFTTGML
jgi:hypothetical protein